jgi:hypothetical protein
MSAPVGKLPKRLLALLGGSVLALLLVEVAARLIPVRSTPDPPVPPEVGRFDPRLGWTLAPGVTAVSSRTGEPIEYRINALGLRGPETTAEKPAGTFRIAFVGDSRTFGLGIPVEEHFTSLAAAHFEDVETLNLGVSGYGVDQELLRLRLEGLALEPDLVVAYVAHYGDRRHMHARRFGKAKPRFVLTDGELVLERATVPEPPGASGPWHWLRAHSVACARLDRALARRRARATPGPAPRRVAQCESEDFQERMHALGVALVAEMDRETRAAGARFVLMTEIPRLHADALAAEVPSLLLPEELLDPSYELPDGLGHITSAGNALVARSLTAFLEQEGLVPGSHRRSSRE